MKPLRLGNSARKVSSVSLTVSWLSTLALAMAILLLPLAGSQDITISSGSFAVAGNGPGGPGDSGSGGGNAGSGKGGGKGNGGSGPDKGDLYGDMIYISRDDWGVPIVDGEGCIDPIAWDGESWIDLPLFHELGFDPTMQDDLEKVPEYCLNDEQEIEGWGIRLRTLDRIKDQIKAFTYDRERDRLRLLLQEHKATLSGFKFVPVIEDVDGELGACDVITLCANNTQEVELGRLSVLRSPARVLDKSRDEIIKVLLKGETNPILDASGRLTVDDSTFDSPLVNLALYREFHLYWQLQDDNQEPTAYFIPGSNNGFFPADFSPHYDAYIAMAFGLAAGADKAGAGVDIDVVSRANAILGLPGGEFHEDLGGGNYRGFPGTLDVTIEGESHYFINYEDFTYTRSDVFPGCVFYDDIVNWIPDVKATLMDLVFNGEDATASNIAGFALAADDARRVLVAIHDLGDTAVHGVDAVFTNSGNYCPSP